MKILITTIKKKLQYHVKTVEIIPIDDCMSNFTHLLFKFLSEVRVTFYPVIFLQFD